METLSSILQKLIFLVLLLLTDKIQPEHTDDVKSKCLTLGYTYMEEL